ncbi:RING/U-box superfamily protein [Striga asiatica]|uniref:RING-type E3 ubiquitin transferase n=1 Tax=Striga asiatica TaxID=4170 RepID=A0A5A7R524_STRAF|nr:RING/U-box superfamily protein [Striga asiatica]
MRKIESLRAGSSVAAAEPNIRLSAPPAAARPPADPLCGGRTCPWWPFTGAADFTVKAVLIVAALFFALFCSLALNVAARYLVRWRCCCCRLRRPKGEDGGGKGAVVVYVEGMKLAREETECTICLSEFAAGERVKVLDKCGHGFHAQCIRRWLAARDSCPTCRERCSV